MSKKMQDAFMVLVKGKPQTVAASVSDDTEEIMRHRAEFHRVKSEWFGALATIAKYVGEDEMVDELGQRAEFHRKQQEAYLARTAEPPF